MALPRCLVEQLPAVGEIAWLGKLEAKHAIGSRRLEAGDAVELVDGQGHIALAILEQDRNDAGETGAKVSSRRAESRVAPQIHVAAAIPKGDRLSTMLDMLGQLSVASFTPLDCERSVVPADRVDAPRATRILVEAMKQSRGAWLAQVRPAATPKSCAEDCLRTKVASFIAHPGGRLLSSLPWDQPSCMILIGPEGGFTDAEIADCEAARSHRISLGSTMLRVETAAVMAAGFVRLRAQPSLDS